MNTHLTHIVALIDSSKSPYCEGHMIQSRAVVKLEHAENIARAWRTECKDTDHIVVIAAIQQIQRLQSSVLVIDIATNTTTHFEG